MKTMDRRAFLQAAAGLGMLSLAGCSSSGNDQPAGDEGESFEYTLVKEGTLIVASDLDFEPLDFVKDGKPQGLDVDLSNEIAKRLGLTCEYLEPQVFETIIPTIKEGGVADIGNSAFTITDERKQDVDFTDPYLESGLAIAVKTSLGIVGGEDAIINMLNAPDMIIAVRPGTTGEDWVVNNIPEATIAQVEAVADCMAGVSSGQYHAFCADLPVVAGQCSSAFTDCSVCLEIPTGDEYGIVVSKDNPGLTAAINAALAGIIEDGTMASLKSKWLGV